jgi:flagellar biosynthesis chaperone FliJ
MESATMNGWYLAPLLALRVRAEERARGELGIALATAQRADELVLARRLALRAGVVEPGGSVVGSELAVAALFLDRLGRELRDALARAGEARAAAGAAQQQHAMARRGLEGLEQERVRWLEARRRAREAAAERELDDSARRCRNPRADGDPRRPDPHEPRPPRRAEDVRTSGPQGGGSAGSPRTPQTKSLRLGDSPQSPRKAQRRAKPVSDLIGSARSPERDPIPQPLHELRVVERFANELVRAGLS